MKVDLTKEELDILTQLLAQVNVKIDQANVLLMLRDKLLNAKE